MKTSKKLPLLDRRFDVISEYELATYHNSGASENRYF
jgi:hypothetical protein